MAQNSPDPASPDSAKGNGSSNATPPAQQDPLDLRLHRLFQRFESEVAFLLPEGEFDAAVEKKFGRFTTQTSAHYNFLRGEMGFAIGTYFRVSRFIPRLDFHDRLNFVPLFSPDRTWRREQGMMVRAGVLLGGAFYTSTNFNSQRFSYPSNINIQALESLHIRAVGQSLGAQVDSARALGFYHSGNFELEFARALRAAGGEVNFSQLRLQGAGVAENHRVRLAGEIQWLSLVGGTGAPEMFLGGRGKLSGFRTNEFSGINFFYSSLLNRLHLRRQKTSLLSPLTMHEWNFVTHVEVGQIGGDKQLRDPASYHASLGLGMDGVVTYRELKAFEVFLLAYKGLERGREVRYYLGVKF